MAAQIINSIGAGYTANQILSFLAKKYPKYKSQFEMAQKAGYSAPQILNGIANNQGKKTYREEDFLTDSEKTKKRDKKSKINAGLQAATIASSSLGPGASALMSILQQIQSMRGSP